MSHVIVTSGRPGTGKTLQGINYPGKKIVVIDLEDKAKKTYDVQKAKGNISSTVDIRKVKAYDKHYKVDPVKTYTNLVELVDDIIVKNIYDIVVLDSVTYLRNTVCADYFCTLKGIKTVGKNNWGHVNGYMRAIVGPLGNYVRATDKTLVITAHMKDVTEKDSEGNDDVVGTEPYISTDIEHLADTIVVLEYNDGAYIARCTRSPIGVWEEDISGEIPLHAILKSKGLI